MNMNMDPYYSAASNAAAKRIMNQRRANNAGAFLHNSKIANRAAAKTLGRMKTMVKRAVGGVCQKEYQKSG
jgi:hypothetical protein